MLEYVLSSNKKKKIIALGNPPYQEDDGGAGASSKQIYPFFCEALMDSKQIDEFILVIKAAWFAGGKGTKPFRDRVLKSKQVKHIRYFEKSEEVFPSVQVKGGICFFHWSEAYDGNPTLIHGNKKTNFDLSKHNIISDDPASDGIVSKVIAKAERKFVSSKAWSRNAFGLGTNYFKLNPSLQKNHKKAIPCYSQGRKVQYANRNHVLKNLDQIKMYKVAIPKAYGKGMRRCTLPTEHIFIIAPGEITTETYNIVGCFKTRSEALRFQSYLQTDFARYLLGLRKLTQDIPKDRWDWVPLMDNSREWTDQDLAKYFKLTSGEFAHIRKKVGEWS